MSEKQNEKKAMDVEKRMYEVLRTEFKHREFKTPLQKSAIEEIVKGKINLVNVYFVCTVIFVIWSVTDEIQSQWLSECSDAPRRFL